MDVPVKAAAVCCLCRGFLDITAPHAIVNHDYAHLQCANEFDARAVHSMDAPERVGSWERDYADAVCIPLHGEL